jgi:hypothetical protein
MSKLHDTYPPKPTHEPIHTARVVITFNLSLEATLEAAQEVERLVKSYTQGQLAEDIQDGFTNWCANIECAEDKDLDFALDLEQLKLDIKLPAPNAEEKRKIEAERRAARNQLIKSLLAEHRSKMPPNLKLVPPPPTSGRKHYATIEERQEAQRARRRELRAAKRNAQAE